jgi:hypothetical protein
MHFALYVIEDVDDAILAGKNEIFDFVIDESECESCGMAIGPSIDMFFPCVVILDIDDRIGQDRWALCIDCAAPLVYPNEWMFEVEL